MLNKNNGFTLMEILFVLGIFSFFLFVTVPIQFSNLEEQEIKQFLKTFQSDVMLVQNLSYASTDRINMTFDQTNHSYMAQTGGKDDLLFERSYPPEWQISSNFPHEGITFRNNGTIEQGGTVTVRTSSDTYKIIFPFGKGRCYVEKQ